MSSKSNRLNAAEQVAIRDWIGANTDSIRGYTLAAAAITVSMGVGITVTGDNLAHLSKMFSLDWGQIQRPRTAKPEALVAPRLSLAEKLNEQLLSKISAMESEAVELKAQVKQLQEYGNEVYAANQALSKDNDNYIKLSSAIVKLVSKVNPNLCLTPVETLVLPKSVAVAERDYSEGTVAPERFWGIK